jgi:hypothetical protein
MIAWTIALLVAACSISSASRSINARSYSRSGGHETFTVGVHPANATLKATRAKIFDHTVFLLWGGHSGFQHAVLRFSGRCVYTRRRGLRSTSPCNAHDRNGGACGEQVCPDLVEDA